jgi:hypothetical protein
MKAWLAEDMVGWGAGLGKMDIIIIPRANDSDNCLVVKVARDGRVWIDEEINGGPTLEDGLQEIEIDDTLAREVDTSFETEGRNLSRSTKNLLIELVEKFIAL